MKRIPFKVDIAGVVEILGRSLYSRRDAAIRELIQNAHDAIMRRRLTSLSYFGEIRLRQDPKARTLTVHDDGVGLTLEEAELYLGTLGIGLSRLIKRSMSAQGEQDATGIIGQFGVGLFSAFLLADSVEVVSRKSADVKGVRWLAEPGAGIQVGEHDVQANGTTVTMHLSDAALAFAESEDLLKETVSHYADFLSVPIFINDSAQRANLLNVSWLEASPDPEVVNLDIEQHFDEAPLDTILIRRERPCAMQGALYITSARTPGFSGRPLVIATLRRMVISRRLDGLIPEWGHFYRGVLELPGMTPTASREDIVRGEEFERLRSNLEQILIERLFELGEKDRSRLQSIIAWHRYTLAGAALDVPPLLRLLAEHYNFQTSHGQLSFRKLAAIVAARPGSRIWFNTARGREPWINRVFSGLESPCVQALRTFESALLEALAVDAHARGEDIEVRPADPADDEFLTFVLGASTLEPVGAAWEDFFAAFCTTVEVGHWRGDEPVLVFLNEKRETRRDFDEIKAEGKLPAAFAGIIDRHLGKHDAERHRMLLNRRHELVREALEGGVHSPLASVLRTLAYHAFLGAGLVPREAEQRTLRHDLEWIADTVRQAPGKGGR
jgi:molecular chaperone HtpG